MELPKVFISHSSVDKGRYAYPIVEKVGRDQCFIDAYDFQPAYRSWDEIVDKLDKSSFFVFLASRNSLQSDWCKDEVSRAKRAYESGKIKHFLVYIIEDGLTYKDMPDWMSKEECFNMKYFRSPIIIGKDINQKLRVLMAETSSDIELDYNLFMGRNQEIEEFQSKKATKPYAKALIVAGRPGSGRKSFARRCMKELKAEKYAWPEKINLKRDDQIEDVISQLNTITYLYSDEYLHDILISEEEVKIRSAVEQITEASQYGYVMIEDDRSIVGNGGHLSHWFDKILRNEDLSKQIKTVVTSTYKLRAYEELDREDLIQIDFSELSFEDRKILLSKFIEFYDGRVLNNDELEEIVKRLVYSPSQLKKIAKTIASRGYGEAKRNLGALEDAGRQKIAEVLSELEGDEDKLSLLLVISELETCSYENLAEILEVPKNQVEEKTVDLIDRSLISEFGPSDSFLRIDTAVANYLRGSGYGLDNDLRKRLEKYIEKSISDDLPSITEDFTTYIITAKKAFLDGRLKINKLFLPSIALRSIINLYHNSGNEDMDNYKKVVGLCEDLLKNGENIHLNTDYREDVTYWMCLALARLGEEKKFFKHVNTFKTDRYNFLKGFWFRNQQDYRNAKEYFQKVIDSHHSPSKKKAQTEMVIVLTQLKEYEAAFNLALELYHSNIDNQYSIIVLFKVAIQYNRKENERLLAELKARLSGLLVKNKEQYIEAMNLYILIRDTKLTPQIKYERIKRLRETYGNNMIKYLREAIEDALEYLNR